MVAVSAPLSSGLLYVDKPVGMSSHDVVGVVRRAARSKRVGHAGTLDPFATGLLVIAVGPCTRLLPYVVGEPKCYEATIAFGSETDTDDRTGTVVRSAAPPPASWLEHADAPERRHAEAALTGTIAQVPPAYSAKHVNGQRAYELARRGREVALEPSTVHVHRWEWLGGDATSVRVRITCGGGTYIRALARDVGRLLNSAAHCAELRRVSSGPANVSEAVSLDQLAPGAIVDGVVSLRSPLGALGDISHEVLDEAALIDLSHGRPVVAHQGGDMAALLQGDRVVAMAKRNAAGRWQPTVVLLGAET